jgi:hypothetical protein
MRSFIRVVSLPANQPPVPLGVPIQRPTVGIPYSLEIDPTFFDQDGDPLNFALSAGAFPPGLGLSNDDWPARSTAPGVQIAVRLQTAAEVSAHSFVDSSGRGALFDDTVAPPGALGSAKMLVLNTDGPASGSLRRAFGPYGAGSTFWISYRFWHPHAHAYTVWPTSTTEPNGHKTSIVSSFAASNTLWECVIAGSNAVGTIGGYYRDGGPNTGVGWEIPQVTACSGVDFRFQPAIDNGANTLTGLNPDTGVAWSPCDQDRRRYGSLYSAQSVPDHRPGLGDPITGGVRFRPGRWTTVTQRFVVGTFGQFNSFWDVWIADEGQPYRKVFAGQNIRFGGTGPFDGIWLPGDYVSDRIAGGKRIGSRTLNIAGASIHACGLGTPLGAGTLEYNATTQRFRWLGAGESFGTARGFSAANNKLLLNVISGSSTTSYLVVEVDPSQLPTSGTVTDTITIADGRPDLQVNYGDLLVSTQAINAPGGHPPT